MFNKLNMEELEKKGIVYPIKYKYRFDKKTREWNNKMTNFSQNTKIKGDYLPPPGAKILSFKDKQKYENIYNIVEKIYDKLNINLKNSVIAYVNEERPKQLIYYKIGDDLDEYLKKNKMKKERIHLYVGTPSKKEGALNVLKSLDLGEREKKAIKNVLVNLLKGYFDKKDYDKIDTVLNKSRLFFLKYTGKHGGHHLHSDSFKRRGPVFIINLGTSFIDYVPFEEISDKRYSSYRFKLNPGNVFIMDGDSRSYYTHGVPTNDKKQNYTRYAILLRVPVYYKKTRLCYLTNNYELKETANWKDTYNSNISCYSDTEDIFNN